MSEYKKNYPLGGMLIITGLCILGIGVLYFTNFFQIRSYTDFHNYLEAGGGSLCIFCFFFIAVGTYCWTSFILNVILPPKEETLYLDQIDEESCIFLNKKGKKYYFANTSYAVKKFYRVLKTHDYIYKVLGHSEDSFRIPKNKESYWLNFYSPMGNFENIFLLPIAYVILLPGLLVFFMASGFQKIYGLLMSAIPLYFIIYDFIYKTKKKKLEKDDIVNDNNLRKSYYILIHTIKLIPIILACIICTVLFLKTKDLLGKGIISIFCLCTFCALGMTISKMRNNEKAAKIFAKMYLIIFLLYWFGMVTLFTINVIQTKAYAMLLFVLPFWIVGIVVAYKKLIKKEKTDENRE